MPTSVLTTIRHCSGASHHTTLPIEPEPTYLFEQQIALKIHSNLVLKKHHPLEPSADARPPTGRSTPNTKAPLLRARVASELAKADIGLSLPS